MYRKIGKICPYSAVEHRREGPVMIHIQVVPCTVPGCGCRFEKRIPGAPFPVEALAKFLRHRNWTVNPNKGQFQCPNHVGGH